MLIIALGLAQVDYLNQISGRKCTLLLDDVAAELDQEHQKRMNEMLADTPAQIIATDTDQSNNLNLAWKRYSKFHVKHGSITEHC